MAKKQESQVGVLEGGLVYCKLAQPDNKYQSKDTEFSIGVVISDDDADEWDNQFKKQPAKRIKTTEFEAKYKLPVPEKFKGEKKVGVVTLKRDAVVNGEEVFPDFFPKVLLDTNEGERVDITKSRLVANGTYGKVSYRSRTNDFGTFAKLANVLVKEDDFIEYVSKGGGFAGSEFGGKPVTKVEGENKAATQARPPREEAEENDKSATVVPTPAKKAKPPVEDVDFESDVPF